LFAKNRCLKIVKQENKVFFVFLEKVVINGGNGLME